MIILRLSAVALTFVAANVLAAEHSAQTALNPIMVRDHARLIVDCRDERVPKLRAVSDVLETNNSALLYTERERLVHTAHRECMRGATRVVFLRDVATTAPALAMAAAATP